MLQTYFTAKGRINYFIVAKGRAKGEESREAGNGTAPEEELFVKLEQDMDKAARDLEEQAGTLSRTGFPAHLRGLRDEEIKALYALPPKRVLDGGDNLNLDEFKGSWLTDVRNAEVLQEFLKRMAVLIHVAPAPPLRSPELLSVTCNNTARWRHVFIWEKMVMVYEQSGAGRDNIRFLPKAIGDLLLMYVARPGALLSPYLWSRLGGEAWKDGTVSSCLRKACARAGVPQFQVAWWRQVAASITKEKFSAKERANFDLEDMACEDIGDEADLTDLAGMSNHTVHTFNHAYAGTTTLTMTVLLHRGYRASASWRNLFRLDHILKVGVKSYVWSPGSSRSAPLIIVSAEAACTPGFLEYAHRLVDRQKLDRIFIDECHLTITAGDYRPCMSQLGWYVRQVRTQTVWLTATLPPVMQELLIEHNKLVRPHMVRESTNRPNIRYIVQREKGKCTLIQRAAGLVRSCWERQDLFKSDRDKIILYCQTKELVAKLADLLGCLSYTSESGTEEEKEAIIQQWLGATGPPAIIATSALGVGFDYPHVRWVIHVGAPGLMTDFSQESGRAGRDGRKAESIVLLSAAWKPQLDQHLGPDKESMQLYLTQQHCSRGVMSQFLDMRPDWWWCMEGDELCGVCPALHAEARPGDLEFRFPQKEEEEEMIFTGPEEVLRQDQIHDEALSRYERDLETMTGCCLYCRVEGRPFEHKPMACSRRTHWIQAKKEALRTRRKEGKDWMKRYLVCWKCYQPQEICHKCRFPDMVMPLCYGAFCRPDRTRWFRKHFQQTFKTQQEYMLWLGETASLGGNKCIQANRVAALVLAELG
ncbi:hypothetical protein QBC46DRAFT_367343 [Diplogelasinospora grovesii]|uniref:DNA 3'-5' helicase n=1 Tax=Diplogelasinospora grovesii TaxID=303347 RepID=A0AAN6MYL6_9PEZI|nr:hypothetical protein QBC46DRAFT_367343 [Diplogelasinospora grovesii]